MTNGRPNLVTSLASLALLLLLGACNSGSPTANSAAPSDSAASEPTVITLTQTGCQFLETESKDYGFKPSTADNCVSINGKTVADREKAFSPLNLKPGTYIFRVTNRDVPYELGFYLRGKGVSIATLPKVSGGGLTSGLTQDYQVTLKPGDYVFSCPLNPTPDYPLVVQ